MWCLFVILLSQLADTANDQLAPFRIAYWDYLLHLSNYQAQETYSMSQDGQVIRNIPSIFVYFEHGHAQLNQQEFHLPSGDRLAFFKRMRAALRSERSMGELRKIIDKWQRDVPEYPEVSWVLPNVPFLNRLKVDRYSYAFDPNPLELAGGNLLRFSGPADSSGTLLLDAQGKLSELKQWLPLATPEGALMTVTLTFGASKSGVVYVARAQRRATLDGTEIWNESWQWLDPRTIRPSMSLGKSLDPVGVVDVPLLLQLSSQVADYDRHLADVSSMETKHMRVLDGKSYKTRTVVSEFVVVPLEQSPNERVELRIVQSVDGRQVDRQGDLIDLMSREFGDRRDEIRRINEFSDRYDLGGSPHGFILNQAPCFNDEMLGYFDHHTEQKVIDGRNFTVISSVQTRGRGLIRGGLLAFRPRFMTFVDESSTIVRVDTAYDIMAPYRTHIQVTYNRNEEGQVFPTHVDYKLFRGETNDEVKTYAYTPFKKIQTLVETEVQTKDRSNR